MIKRIRRAPIEPPDPPKTVQKPEHVYHRTPVSGKKDLFVDQYGTYWKQYEGDWLKCWPSGNLRDQETDRWRVHYGRAFEKSCLSPEEDAKLSAMIRKKMEECFPGSPYLNGKIPIKRVYDEED